MSILPTQTINYDLYADTVRNKIWQAFKDNDIEFNLVGATIDYDQPEGTALVVALDLPATEEPLILPFLLDSVIKRDIDEFVGLFVEIFSE